MKNENIPADIKSKSLKETRDEIDKILIKLEKQESEHLLKKSRILLKKKIKKCSISFY